MRQWGRRCGGPELGVRRAGFVVSRRFQVLLMKGPESLPWHGQCRELTGRDTE